MKKRDFVIIYFPEIFPNIMARCLFQTREFWPIVANCLFSNRTLSAMIFIYFMALNNYERQEPES